MLDKYQQEIVDSNEPRIIVEAGAGSGKTYTLIERVKRLLLDGIEPSNMVIITFTRMAAEELKERLIDVPGIGDCFVGTIHAFANKIFQNSNETYKLYSDEIENQFMTVLVNLYSKHITMDKFFIYKDIMKKIDLGLKTEIDLNTALTQNEIYEIEVFIGKIENDEYPETVKTLCKKHNVITFDELLKKTTEYFKEINGKVEYLFVDEFQDIGKLEKNFFEALNADNYFYVRRRETTEFIALNGGNVNYFLNLMKSHKWKTYYLNNNYRCGSKIIYISNKVIQQADDIINTETICMSKKEGNYKIDSKYKIDQYLEYIKVRGDYVDWFVLTRTNKDIAKLEILLSALNIPYVSFKKGEMTLEEMRKFMAENKVKLLTVHTSKGLESKNVLLYGNFPIKQKPYLRNNDEIKIQYVGMTRAMERLIILN